MSKKQQVEVWVEVDDNGNKTMLLINRHYKIWHLRRNPDREKVDELVSMLREPHGGVRLSCLCGARTTFTFSHYRI